jgi:hypothetical protein
VKAHSGITLNEEADKLANLGRNSQSPILINHKALNIPLSIIWDPYNTRIPIDIR